MAEDSDSDMVVSVGESAITPEDRDPSIEENDRRRERLRGVIEILLYFLLTVLLATIAGIVATLPSLL